MAAMADRDRLLALAQGAEAAGQVLQADLGYRQVLARWPQTVAAAQGAARLALRRGDVAQAVAVLDGAHAMDPTAEALVVDRAMVRVRAERPDEARTTLEQDLAAHPDHPVAWLLLAGLLDDAAHAPPEAALQARFQAVTRAMSAGLWRDDDTTPPALADKIAQAKQAVKAGRPALLRGSYADLRREFGDDELRRVDRALDGYLGDAVVRPPSERQRPSFLYFPGLPNTAYHDPYWQPWAARLQARWQDIRDEALAVMAETPRLQDFVDVPPGQQMEDYVGGAGPSPAWEAYFFYRHGQRYDAHHARCPVTSAVLESLDLCRLPAQAPEILYSVLRPGSHIKRHYGTSNIRLVLHLPLIVPGDCALNVVDAGEHRWEPGRLMMFDDTYLHEAWNRSDRDRVVLLMDCWHPHLSLIERRALQRLIETITAFSRANRGR